MLILLPSLVLANNNDSVNDTDAKKNTQTVQVNFYVDENLYSSSVITKGALALKPINPPKELWPENTIFRGWFEKHGDNKYKPFAFNKPVNCDKDLYALFKAPDKYAVVFLNGETKDPKPIQKNIVKAGAPIPPFDSKNAKKFPENYVFLNSWFYYDIETSALKNKVLEGDCVNSDLFLFPLLSGNAGTAYPPPPGSVDNTEPQNPDNSNKSPVATKKPKPKDNDDKVNKKKKEDKDNNNNGNGNNSKSNKPNKVDNASLSAQSNSTELSEVASLDDAKTILPSKTPLYPNHAVKLSPIIPPISSGDGLSAFNFGLSGATGILMLLMFITYFTKGKKGLGKVNKHGALRLLSLVPTIASLLILVPTQDFNKPLIMTNDYSIHFATFLLVQLILAILARKSYSYEDIEDVY